MSLLKIAWRSIQRRALASTLTAVSMGLGVALVVAVLVIHTVVDQSFRRGGGGYNLIVGPKGGRLELVLNSVYYLGRPMGTIPRSYYREFTEGEFALDVEMAVPICLGHHYKDTKFLIIGTTSQMFDEIRYRDRQKYEFAEGRNLDDAEPFEAVIGHTAARETGLKVDDTFDNPHGGKEADEEDPVQFTVVGVLARTGTPNDKAIFINWEGFHQIHSDSHEEGSHEHDAHAGHDHAGHDHAGHDHAGHDHAGHDPTGRDAKTVSALLVYVDPIKLQVVERQINEGLAAQAVYPAVVIADFLENVIGDVQLILLIMAVLIVVVAGLGIMVSIYNSMSDRRHEIAIMRALGASRLTVMLVILLESILLSLGGGLLGLVLGHGLIGLLSPIIAEQTNISVGMLHLQTIELVLIPGLIALASVVGYLPAAAAYRTDVARSLTAAP